MRRFAHSRAAALAAAVPLFLSVALSSVLVLCSGAQGHVAVESVLADDCCGEEPAHDTGAAEAWTPDCGGCVDVPLRTGSAVRPPRPPDPAPRAALAPPSVPAPPPATALCAAARAASAAPEPALRARRSVVLLV
jgi:hypothetical protein